MSISENQAQTYGCKLIPSGYTKGNDGFFYKVYSEKKSWNDAERRCASEGGHLAIIYSDETRNAVKGLMKRQGTFKV